MFLQVTFSHNRACLLQVSVIPPVSIHTPSSRTGTGGGWWRGVKPPGCSPLLVFVNSKSGDNQVTKSSHSLLKGYALGYQTYSAAVLFKIEQ